MSLNIFQIKNKKIQKIQKIPLHIPNKSIISKYTPKILYQNSKLIKCLINLQNRVIPDEWSRLKDKLSSIYINSHMYYGLFEKVKNEAVAGEVSSKLKVVFL